MSENIRMDSHKLIYHPERVAAWLRGGGVYPIELEVGLSGACNHRCIFCNFDYMGYQTNYLDTEIYLRDLKDMAENGVKSIIYAGEGEPLLHKDAPFIFNRTKELGVSSALSTNGVFLTKNMAEECLGSMTWVRYSIAAATDKTYEMIQTAREGDLQRVYKNLADAVAVKRTQNLSVTLGAQMLLLEENKDEAVLLAKNLREIGIDYLAIKPFMQNPLAKHRRQVDYSESSEIEREVRELETDSFTIHFRHNAIKNIAQEKPYDVCYALPFMTRIDAKGDVFPCITFVGKPEFLYGNIYKSTFDEIWRSKRTKEVMNKFQGKFLHENCQKGCRLDEMNKYLHELKHPGAHVDFI